MRERRDPDPLTLRVGHEELLIRRRYETASILNDVCIALWFVAGSIMFFSTAWAVTGTWCFLLGSLQLLVRPTIRLTRQIHLRRVRDRGVSGGGRAPTEAPQDF